jgi:hypothetical protein
MRTGSLPQITAASPAAVTDDGAADAVVSTAVSAGASVDGAAVPRGTVVGDVEGDGSGCVVVTAASVVEVGEAWSEPDEQAARTTDAATTHTLRESTMPAR